MAQTDDIFGKVPSGFQNSMNLTGYVRMVTMVNGQWSTVNDEVLGNETVVAVYCGNELRGKASPTNYGTSYISLLRMTIYGNNNDKLHFKVLTGGRVIEVAPEGFVFVSDETLGKAKDPYYIDLPAPVTTTFSTEGWATTCLPYDALVPEGVTLWDATAIEDGELKTEALQLPTVHSPLGDGAEISILPKGTPVLIECTGKTSCEWLSRVADVNVTTTGSILVGTTEKKEVAANSVLTLGHSKGTGELGFWCFTGTEIPAYRAYIADFPSGTDGARINTDHSTGIAESSTVNPQWSMVNPQWSMVNGQYDLQGRRLNTETNSSLITSHSSLKKMWKKNAKGQIIIIR